MYSYSNTFKIPFFGLDRQYSTLKDEILDATNEVYKSGNVLDGKYATEFENAIAKRCNRKYAISVNSCSTALLFALLTTSYNYNYDKSNKKLKLADRKVLIPAQSFVATLNSVILSGQKPFFCDVDHNALLDISTLDSNLQDENILTIMYVNLFGNILDYDKLELITKFFEKESIPIIEDAAQSFGGFYKGRPSGSLGTISCLSFDPTKNLPNYGSGGMVLTDDNDCNNYIKNLKDNGKLGGHYQPGINSKMSEVDCAQMLVKLKYFDQWQKRRTEIAEYYSKELRHTVYVPDANENVIHAWHKYVIGVPRRFRTMEMLGKFGIDTRIHYSTSLNHYDLAYDHAPNASKFFEGAEIHSKNTLSLPIYPELLDSEVECIVNSVKSCIES